MSQVVDLQRDEAFEKLNVELLSIATDPPDAWEKEAESNDIQTPLLSDVDARVSNDYDVMQWAMGGEPGHTFVLIDRDGEIAWVRDYGAPDNGGLMYVDPKDVVAAIEKAPA